jgi:adenylate cyclase
MDTRMERRLAAILSLDMVAYSRLVEADESGTLTRLRSLIGTLVEPAVEQHHGRVVKGTGDGVLAEFADAKAAIACAAAIQQSTAAHESSVPKDQRIEFRIGINVGEIYAEDGDIYGTGVNVAARLEALADPGGILVSASAREQMADSEDYGFENLGPHLVKNIKTPVQVYRLLPNPHGKGILPLLKRLRKRKIVQWAVAYFAGAWLVLEVFDLVAEQFLMPVWVRQGATILVLFGLLATIVLAWYHGERGRQKIGWSEMAALTVILLLAGQSLWLLKSRHGEGPPGAPPMEQSFRVMPAPENSVAVLPCLNLSGDEEQSYFADGLAAEVITRLAAVSRLRIASHTSSFSFKGQNISLRDIADALRVRHILECDVFGDESRLKVSARLVDAESGYTLWSRSYNRMKAQLFDVQQDVARSVVDNLEIELAARERALVSRRWTEHSEAYDEFLQGLNYTVGFPTEERINRARSHLEQAIELDPTFARAYALLAVSWIVVGNFQFEPPDKAYAEARRLANIAIELDAELYESYWALGWAELSGRFAWQDAQSNFRKTIELAPGEWAGYHSLGYVLGTLGNIEQALQAARIAIDLDPLAFWPRHGHRVLLTRQRDYAAIIPAVEDMAEIFGWNFRLQGILTDALWRAGRTEEARAALTKLEAMVAQDEHPPLGLAQIYASFGERDRALGIIEQWEGQARESNRLNLAGAMAAAHGELGLCDQAMEWLIESRKQGELWILFLDDEAFDCLRDDRRFAALVKELGLPEDRLLSKP